MALHLQGTVSLDGSGFEAGLKKLEQGAHRFGESLKELAVEAFGVYSVAASVHRTIEMADELLDMSRRLGIGAEALQEFGFAARQNGADLEKFAGFVEKLNSARIDPAKWDAFKKLGISQEALRSARVEEIILQLSTSVRNRSSQEVIGPLREIGGRGAGELLPMLKENLEEVREEARRLGQVMRTEDAVMLKYLADEMKILAQTVLVGLAPAIVFVVDKFMQFINVIKLVGTFLGSLFATINLRNLLGAITGSAPMNFVRAIAEQFQDAVIRSGLEFSENEGAREEQKRKLLQIQRAMEKINEHPDFQSVMPEEKTKKGREVYTDALLRVGNFLGAGRSGMEQIGERQVQLLTTIARHTQTTAEYLLQHGAFSTMPAPATQGTTNFPP